MGRGDVMQRQKLILTVDDSVAMRLSIRNTLRSAGYEVVEADNGQTALELLADKRVDLVLSDLNMPQVDGIEFVRRMKSSEALKSIPVIMVTTENQKKFLSVAREAGAIGWMYKPFKPEHLLMAVQKVFEKISPG